MNKPCYNDYDWFKKKVTIFRSEEFEMVSTFQRKRYFRKVSVNKTFTHVQEQEKALLLRHSVWCKIALTNLIEYNRLKTIQTYFFSIKGSTK